MQFLNIKFRNFESYGNNWNEISFNPDKGAFSCVLGDIGAGKSSIANVIIYGLYGKLQKKTLKAIPNRFNGHMEVHIDLLAGGKQIHIHRGHAPSIFEVTIDGKNLEGAGKTAVQNILEEEYLGIPFHIFNNVITLSINDFKSFINMSPADKRQIIDKIFGLYILNEMNEVLKKELQEKDSKLLQIRSSLSSIEYSIQNSQKQLEILEAKIQSNFIKKHQEITSAIEKYKEVYSDLSEKKSKATAKISDVKLLTDQTEKQIRQAKEKLRDLKKQQELYHNSICPTCKSSLDTDAHKSHLEELQATSKTVEEEMLDLEKSWQEKASILNRYNAGMSQLEEKLNDVTYKVRAYSSELEKLKAESNLEEAKNSIITLIEDSNKKMTEVMKDESKVTSSKSLLQEVGGLLSDKGIKRLALQQIIPTLNKEVMSLLVSLGCRFKVEFDDQFNAKLWELGYEVPLESLSTGESKVVDFAVLMSFIKLMKTKFPNLNLLFLDEIFASIDPNHRLIILHILKDMSKDVNLNIFVINHAELPYELFDDVLQVYKKDNFSNVKSLTVMEER